MEDVFSTGSRCKGLMLYDEEAELWQTSAVLFSFFLRDVGVECERMKPGTESDVEEKLTCP